MWQLARAATNASSGSIAAVTDSTRIYGRVIVLGKELCKLVVHMGT
jgi:hypothetical protein